MTGRHDMADAEWALIAPWRDLPERYGPYTTVYNR